MPNHSFARKGCWSYLKLQKFFTTRVQYVVLPQSTWCHQSMQCLFAYTFNLAKATKKSMQGFHKYFIHHLVLCRSKVEVFER